jgi:hypothetical protein
MAAFRDIPSILGQFAIFSEVADYPTNGGVSAEHRVRFYDDSGDAGYLRECEIMSEEGGYCLYPDYIKSAHPISVAWDNSRRYSVLAWVNQSRSNTISARRVRVSVAPEIFGSTFDLPTARTISDVQSIVSPGLVCRWSAVSDGVTPDYDCLLAVVPQTDSLMRVRIYRFRVSYDGLQLFAEVSPNSTVLDISTGSRIAVWYQSQKFWMVVRSLEQTSSSGHTIRRYSSADSTSWTYEDDVAPAQTGPSVAPYYSGMMQYIGYTR